MNLVGRLRAAKKAEAKAAATAPAQFRRITKLTKVTAPCVLACRLSGGAMHGRIANTEFEVRILRDSFSYWLPVQWPEVRG